ncbi:hypothetical protein [uncultured Eudoraea sp.]|uniref:hypothetical protein n=1 Tax=uncultured Eudoraea sp. TaxID=1035614 RepID=UPI002630CD04|nr:hypothetical protein [uncultured Eudoraea sp.]
MKNLKTIVSSFLVAVAITGLNAQNPNCDENQFDLNSIEYIEEENFDLGFNTSEYLPEDFDPYSYYVNLDSIAYVEVLEVDIETEKNLPANFDVYANPSDFRDVSYIDPNDEIQLEIETEEYLPADFDPYATEVSIDNNTL